MKTLSHILGFIKKFPLLVFCMFIGLLGITIYLCFKIKTLNLQLSKYEPVHNSRIDVTTYNTGLKGKRTFQTTTIAGTESKFKEVPHYPGVKQPEKILYWDSKISAGTSSSQVGKTSSIDSSITTNKSISGFYFRDFSSNTYPAEWSPSKDSLVQLLLDRNNIAFSFYNRGAQKYLTKSYTLDLERYKYNWAPSFGLTYEKKALFEISPYIYGRYLVFQKVPTIGTGIQFKTRKIDYNLGVSWTLNDRINTYSKFKPDLELQVTYRFKKWLK